MDHARWMSFVLLGCAACASPLQSADAGASDAGGIADAGASDGATSGCTLAANTSASGTTSASGCALLTRDTSSCRAERQAATLSGYWLRFSCRVSLLRTATTVKAESDGRPDYLSNYFAASDPCHETYSGGVQNPNTIATKAYSVDFPLSPDAVSTTMRGPVAIVGLALNGVPIFGNFAAPGDDIFAEAATFDRCGAHPQMQGAYHYHSEPSSISDDDDHFIGVMRDGYPIYGRRDPDGTLPTLDAAGGHVGPTSDDATPAYHYHVNAQTSTSGQTVGQMQWFLTTGTYHGTPATCAHCE